MAVREVLLLGNENLYRICRKVSKDEIEMVKQVVTACFNGINKRNVDAEK